MECGSAAIWPSDRVGKHGTLLPPAALILLFQSNMFLSDFGKTVAQTDTLTGRQKDTQTAVYQGHTGANPLAAHVNRLQAG